jgi:threonine dehydratase
MTPLENFGPVYLKREDKNLTGSAKDRSLDLQTQQNIKKAVISSSGNAAISAQYFCKLKNIDLTVFVSPKTNPHKLKLINNYTTSNKPVSDAFKFAKNTGAYFLRQSTDPIALLGYQQIGKELVLQCPKITSLFVPVGSGTTLLGISQTLPKSVKIFAVQPASYCPIASHFDKNFTPETTTVTDALSAKLLPLKSKVISACFSGIVVQDLEVKNIIDTSPEGNLAYAGYLKAIKNHPVGDYPVILLTGAKR